MSGSPGRRVLLLDLTTGPERVTYHIECVGPAYLAGRPYESMVELDDVGDDTSPDDPLLGDDCAWCGGPVREPPWLGGIPPEATAEGRLRAAASDLLAALVDVLDVAEEARDQNLSARPAENVEFWSEVGFGGRALWAGRTALGKALGEDHGG